MSKWLIRKTSGSRTKYKMKGDYADIRNRKKSMLEDLPHKEPMRRNYRNDHFSYLNTSPVRWWLNTKAGNDFDTVCSEFLTRIQPKHLERYPICILLVC